jgi:hypothetical protein
MKTIRILLAGLLLAAATAAVGGAIGITHDWFGISHSGGSMAGGGYQLTLVEETLQGGGFQGGGYQVNDGLYIFTDTPPTTAVEDWKDF